MQEEFDTSRVREDERLSYWRDAVCRNLNGITCRSADGLPFNGRLIAKNAEDHVVARLAGGRHRAIRTEKARREMGDDFFVLFYQLEGTMGVSINDDEFDVRPNEFYFYDSRHNHQLIFENNFNHIAIRVPRTKLRARWNDLSRMGSFRFPTMGDPMAMLVGSNVKTLAAVSHELTTPQIKIAVDNVLELFSANLQDHRRERSEPVHSHRAGSHARALSYIDRHIADEKLGADRIAEHLGISRRYLDMLFERHDETVQSCIRSRRLQNCARELREPNGNRMSISEIAYGWGFRNAAHFSKVFRAEFGTSPRQYRASKIVISQQSRS